MIISIRKNIILKIEMKVREVLIFFRYYLYSFNICLGVILFFRDRIYGLELLFEILEIIFYFLIFIYLIKFF